MNYDDASAQVETMDCFNLQIMNEYINICHFCS